MGRRPRRLPARRVSRAVGRVERPLPRHGARGLARRATAQAGSGSGGARDLAYALTRLVRRLRRGGRGPLASVNFVTAHDGFTLRDLVSYDHKHNEANGEDKRDGSRPQPVAGTAASRARPTTPRCWRCAGRLIAQPARDAAALDRGADAHRGRRDGPHPGRQQQRLLPRRRDHLGCRWAHEPWQRDLLRAGRARCSPCAATTPSLRHGRATSRVGRLAPTGSQGRSPGSRAEGEEMTAERVVRPRPADARHVPRRRRHDGGQSLLVLLNSGPAERAGARCPATPWAPAYDALLDTADEQPGGRAAATHAGQAVRWST